MNSAIEVQAVKPAIKAGMVITELEQSA